MERTGKIEKKEKELNILDILEKVSLNIYISLSQCNWCTGTQGILWSLLGGGDRYISHHLTENHFILCILESEQNIK